MRFMMLATMALGLLASSCASKGGHSCTCDKPATKSACACEGKGGKEGKGKSGCNCQASSKKKS